MTPERYAEIVKRLKAKMADGLDKRFIDNSEINAVFHDDTVKITVEGLEFIVILSRRA